ncbi:hypothetical protein C0214_09405 [Methylobacterium sp. DM1]|nr:hypothetical protein C0214_09405 [Methylobacterium sp. DM1]
MRSGLGLYQVGMSKGVVAEMLVRLLLVGSKVSLGEALIGLLDVRLLKIRPIQACVSPGR